MDSKGKFSMPFGLFFLLIQWKTAYGTNYSILHKHKECIYTCMKNENVYTYISVNEWINKLYTCLYICNILIMYSFIKVIYEYLTLLWHVHWV